MAELREPWVSPRTPRPDARLDVYGAMGATALAAVVYVAALWLRVLPPAGFSVVLFAAAPLFAAIALPILLARARADRDRPLAWFGAGLAVSLVAMVLQLVTFPAVVGADGGPLRASNTASAQLYLIYHAALPAAVVAAGLRWSSHARTAFVVVGSALSVAAAADLVPSPELLDENLRYTRPLVVIEVVLACAVAAAAWGWIRQVGRAARPLRGWAGVALSLSCYDVVLNALAAERYQPVWWGSLSLRVATFAVLAFGAIGALLAGMRRLERYTATELDRSDADVRRSAAATEQLLVHALALSRATTVGDVADALVAACLRATGLPRASAVVLDPATGQVHTAVRRGYDPETRARLDALGGRVPKPSSEALRRGRPLWFSSAEELRELYPDVETLPIARGTQSFAALPLTSAGTSVGVISVSGDEPHAWDAAERELLAGLVTQAGQAIQRAVLFEQHRTTALVLQQGLLPQRLPDVPGVRLAARYVAGAGGSGGPGRAVGSDGAAIGGDWYDCLLLPDGRAVLVLGDVMGKGVQAATRMAQIRQAVRVLASIDPAPSAVLTALDDLPDLDDEDRIITLVYVLLDPAAGTARIGRAGHLPPVHAAPDGVVTSVEGGASPPLGVPPMPRPEAVLEIGPGDTLVMFTDGLVEDRRTGLDPGLSAVHETIARVVREGADADAVAEALLAARRLRGAPSDDTCLLVARLERRSDDSAGNAGLGP